MQVDEIPSQRKKTSVPSEINAIVNQRSGPNIIGNQEEQKHPVVSSSRAQGISMRELEQQAGSKSELYNLLIVQGQLFLPPLKSTSLAFIRQILSGEKSVYQNHEVVHVNAPRFKELTVAKIAEMIADTPQILKYLPEDYDRMPRLYLFDIVNTVVPSFFARVIPDAEEKRQKPAQEEQMIFVEPKMLQLIKCFRATRLGRKTGGLHLLKKGARKRKRAEFRNSHHLSTTIKDAIRQKTEPDVFKRISLQQELRRPDRKF